MLNKPNKTLSDFQPQWEKLVGKALSGFPLLTKEERVWFTVQSLIDCVDNGGLISHYYNTGANYNAETIDDLNYLGFPDISALLIKINQLFPNGNVSNNIDLRNDIISSWPANKYDGFLDELDQQFYYYEKGLENKLLKHIETKF